MIMYFLKFTICDVANLFAIMLHDLYSLISCYINIILLLTGRFYALYVHINIFIKQSEIFTSVDL